MNKRLGNEPKLRDSRSLFSSEELNQLKQKIPHHG